MPKTRSTRLKAAADAGAKSKLQLALSIITVIIFALDGISIYLIYMQYANNQPLDFTWFIGLTILGFILSISSEVIAAVQRYVNSE